MKTMPGPVRTAVTRLSPWFFNKKLEKLDSWKQKQNKTKGDD